MLLHAVVSLQQFEAVVFDDLHAAGGGKQMTACPTFTSRFILILAPYLPSPFLTTLDQYICSQAHFTSAYLNLPTQELKHFYDTLYSTA